MSTNTTTIKKQEQKTDNMIMSGADMVIQALLDNGVDTIFGYPGGAVLPIYDAIFQSGKIKHILVRHEQAALHAAEGYARSTGKVGAALVTSGPGATNAVTGLTDALLDSVPIICISGQVPTFLIGNDAFQEADTTGITRPCTKHNYLVKKIDKLAETIHEAFHVAKTGRPGPVIIDLPKDIQFAEGTYKRPDEVSYDKYQPQIKPQETQIEKAIKLITSAKKPVFYTGGGVINSGKDACDLMTQFVRETGFPITSTLMGLGSYPANDKQWLGMLGMHGTYEANMTMHDCDVMICIGARFDDRVTGRTDAFAPFSKKIHIDVDPSSINKNIHVDVPIVSDAKLAIKALMEAWKKHGGNKNKIELENWWKLIEGWRNVKCLSYKSSEEEIKPQYALERLREAIKGRDDVFVTTEVGQHQMWAAQFLPFNKPNRWMTSGGLGTMGYGLPSAIGVQTAHPDALVIDISGEASFQMNMQELGTAIQYKLPVKIFILNNQWMGMVRQWQELLHGERYSETYSNALPDFVKLANAYGGKGIVIEKPSQLDEKIKEMIESDVMTIVDVRVSKNENCFPMIPSGKAHNDMLLSPSAEEIKNAIGAAGKKLV